jgi:hypothetical protein
MRCNGAVDANQPEVVAHPTRIIARRRSFADTTTRKFVHKEDSMERNDGTTCACGGVPVKGRRCRQCLNRDHREQKARRRAGKMKPCRCGALIQPESTTCKRCNMAGVGAATHHAMPPEHTLPPIQFTGLRGPGGEMEAFLSGQGGIPVNRKWGS